MGTNDIETTIRALERTAATIDTWVLIFSVVAALGVLGSAIFGIKHWSIDRQLRPLRAEQTRLHETTLATLQNETAHLQKQNLELQTKIAGRRIDQNQHEILVTMLSGKLPPLIVVDYVTLPEAMVFADDIRRTLVDAGAKEVRRSSFGGSGEVWIGDTPLMGLAVKPGIDFDATVFEDALQKANIPFAERPEIPLPFGRGSPSAMASSNQSETRAIGLLLYVGAKPADFN